MLSTALKRVRYSKIEGGYLIFVIAEFAEDGTVEFWSQESGEVRWFRFTPKAEERTAVIALAAGSENRSGAWPLLEFEPNV